MQRNVRILIAFGFGIVAVATADIADTADTADKTNIEIHIPEVRHRI
ncbi:hypothetical protein ISS37_07420 [candidate division KSB1 bacterium]|nr:hypothetical protein [candidate division KSB1 bacterium]